MPPKSTPRTEQILYNAVRLVSSSMRSLVIISGAIPDAFQRSALLIFYLQGVSKAYYKKWPFIRPRPPYDDNIIFLYTIYGKKVVRLYAKVSANN